MKTSADFNGPTCTLTVFNQMKTHYDVLNLQKTCSPKEIKESFIKLSKLYHPDKNKSSDAHKKFVEVNEAYSVLGKPETRSQYDNSLMSVRPSAPFKYGPSTVNVTPYQYYTYKYASDLGRERGTTGTITTKKVGIFVFCCLLMMIGSGIQMKAIMNKKRKQEQVLAQYLKEARERKRLRKEKLKEMEAALLKTADVEK